LHCHHARQTVHELRHKRHALKFYEACRTVLNHGGVLLVCDHVPKTDSARDKAMFMTEEEQVAAIQAAGFSTVQTVLKMPERVACQAIA
jgi:predicted methyltransferase